MKTFFSSFQFALPLKDNAIKQITIIKKLSCL